MAESKFDAALKQTAPKAEPPKPVKADDEETPAMWEVAPRAICTCGDKMVRPKGKKNWYCMKLATGNNPTKECQKIPGDMILTEEQVRQRDEALKAKAAVLED